MLHGPHIILRLLEEKDFDEFIRLSNDFRHRGDFPDYRLFPLPQRLKEFRDTGLWTEHKGILLITDKSNHMLGCIAFFRNDPSYSSGYEIGYVIFRRDDWGNGYATEALRIFSAYLFELKPIPRLQVATAVGHAASRRVAEKCGYRYEGTLRQAAYSGGKHVDLELLSLLKEECPRLSEILKT
jgi:RimJ/RimL family protein N-acetyltransferase